MSTYWHGGAPGLQPGDIIEPTTGYDRGKAEGRVIGVALALDTIRQETRR